MHALPHMLPAACGFIPWATGKINEVGGLGTNAFRVGAVIFLLIILIFRHTIKALLVAAALVWLAGFLILGTGVPWGASQIAGETGSAAITQVTSAATGAACAPAPAPSPSPSAS